MITFKNTEDLSKLSPDDPAYTTVNELIEQLIEAYTWEEPPTSCFLWVSPFISSTGGNHMFEQYVIDALETVSTWDISDEDFADAVNDQARLMAGVNPDELPERHPDTH